jgi:predicted DNA-binding WGR domain protein
VVLRELVGGDPPYTCQLIFLDDPTAFGHRVTDGGRVLEHVLTKPEPFEQAVAEKIAEGFTETERSLTRRVFTTADRFWVVSLDGDTLRTQSGGIRADWRGSSGRARDKEFRDRDRAVAAYHRAIADKQAEGYLERYARPVVIADAPAAPKKPGRRKSR